MQDVQDASDGNDCKKFEERENEDSINIWAQFSIWD